MQNAMDFPLNLQYNSCNTNNIEIFSLIDNLTPNTINLLNNIKNDITYNQAEQKINLKDNQFTVLTLENEEIQLKFDEIKKERDFLSQQLATEKENSMGMENEINFLRIEKQLFLNLNKTLSKSVEESQKSCVESKSEAASYKLDLFLHMKKHECLKKEFKKLESENKELADKLKSNNSNNSNDNKEQTVKRKFDTLEFKDEDVSKSKVKGNKFQRPSPEGQRIFQNLNQLFETDDLIPKPKEEGKRTVNIRKVQFQYTNCEISNNNNTNKKKNKRIIEIKK